MLWELLVLLVLVWVVQRRWFLRRQRALESQLRTNLKMWPVVGHSWKFLGSDTDRMNLIENHGRDAIAMGGVSKFMHFDHLLLCVADPVTAEVLLRECLNKHDIMKVLDFVIGNGSFIAPVLQWRPRRKALLPAFNTINLTHFLEIFSENARTMVHLLEREVDKGTFSFWDYVSTYAFSSICESTMGVEMSAEGGEFLAALKRLWENGAYAMFRPWYQYTRLRPALPRAHDIARDRDTLWHFVDKVIKEKREVEKKRQQTFPGEQNIKSKPSFLGRQIEAPDHQRLSDKGLFEESVTLLVGGFDTSATVTTFVALLLATHPHVQDKVYAELQDVFGESDRALTLEDLPRLRYLDAVIKETLRLYPIAPIIGRNVDKDIKLPCGVTAVKGCGALINIWAIHRHPAYWGADAELFRPDRFLASPLKHPAAYMPFSYGPRNCIGIRYALMSMKTVLCTLLRRYRLLPPPGVRPGEPLRTGYNVIIKHTDNCLVRIQRRN